MNDTRKITHASLAALAHMNGRTAQQMVQNAPVPERALAALGAFVVKAHRRTRRDLAADVDELVGPPKPHEDILVLLGEYLMSVTPMRVAMEFPGPRSLRVFLDAGDRRKPNGADSGAAERSSFRGVGGPRSSRAAHSTARSPAEAY